MRHEMTPNVMWKESNLPERMSQRKNRIKNVKIRGKILRVGRRDRTAPDGEAFRSEGWGVSIWA